MKKHLYKFITCALLFVAAMSANAANGIIEQQTYSACAGDVLTISSHQIRVVKDTIIRDTIPVTDPNADSIYVYIVNALPSYRIKENRDLEHGTSFVWQGVTISAGGHYERAFKTQDGCDSTYILTVTERYVKPVKELTFTICDNETLTFNGKVYASAGTYYEDYTADSIYKITIVQLPKQLYVQEAYLGSSNEYIWQYNIDGMLQSDTLTEPGVYEHSAPNPETGCNDIWRLILTQDENSYYFVEEYTICEGEDFVWQGLQNLSHTVGTNTYKVKYKTPTGNDSIFILNLTVKPVIRTEQTRYFCDRINWSGKTYTESTIVYDSIALPEGCYEIRRTNLNKAPSYHYIENKNLMQGDTIMWRGLTIYGEGTYTDHYYTNLGCDSIYELNVTSQSAPQANMYVEQRSICHGDTLLWRDKYIWAEGRYVDSVPATATSKDSVIILNLTVWPSYAQDPVIRHLYACGETAFIRYQGKEYYKDTMVIDTLATIHGCDSITHVYLHFNTALYLSDTVTITDQQLPYTWHYRLNGEKRDTVLLNAGTYHHYEPAEGSCVNTEELVLIVNPTYLIQDSIRICESDLPFTWFGGPADHVGEKLWQQPGTTKQYEYRYKSVYNTDSIYRLYLTVDIAPKDTIRVFFCEGDMVEVNNKTYLRIKSDSVYRDTAYRWNPLNECDSIIYYEISQYPQRRYIETAILHPDDTIEWKGNTITSGGTYNAIPDSIDPRTGCLIIQQLRVIQDMRESRIICKIDTADDVDPEIRFPYIWNRPSGVVDTLTTSGLWTDTVYDTGKQIVEFHSLDLTITLPADTTVFLHGCYNTGVTWRDKTYKEDTVFVDRIEAKPYDRLHSCDSVFHVHIIIDTVYNIIQYDTICEHQLPYIVGQGDHKDSVYTDQPRVFNYLTAGGCDSIVDLRLTIIPDFPRIDSAFVCQDFFDNGTSFILGDTVHPAFDPDRQKVDEWKGKWVGVSFNEDTIVYNCDSTKWFHIIVRPVQKMIKDTVLYLCPDDSLQLFWPRDDSTWFYKDTIYEEHVPMSPIWNDEHHPGYSYADDSYVCDSVTRWHIKKLPLFHKDTTAHIPQGDSLWWGGAWRYYPGVYDSIAKSPDTSSMGDTCMYIYPLTLILDSAYHYRDTTEMCVWPNRMYSYTWDDGYVQKFHTEFKDTVFCHFLDTLKTFYRQDSIYDLTISYRLMKDTLLFDTICEDAQIRFDSVGIERWISIPGIYHDTLTAVNGCDSVITLMLYAHKRVPVSHSTVHIPDTVKSYAWKHSWIDEDGNPVDSVRFLTAAGDYECKMISSHGCDSIDSLTLVIHNTYRIQEDSLVYCFNEVPITWHNRNDIIETGDYEYHTLTHDGYDSIRFAHIEIRPILKTVIVDSICEGDSLRFGSSRLGIEKYVKDQGIYYDTLLSYQYGCDSIIELRLNVNPKYNYNYQLIDIADKDLPYTWEHYQGGKLLSTEDLFADGEYAFHFTSTLGCDSVDSLSLRVHQTYNIREDTIHICSDQTPYTWCDHNNISESGEYTFYGQTVDGYDSVRSVYINVWPVQYTNLNASICEGSAYEFHGEALTEQGSYTWTGVSMHGCDSVVTLHLSINKPYYDLRIEHIIEGQKIDFFEHKDCSTTGTYYHFGHTDDGCDSTSVLQLIVHKQVDTVVTVCSSELPYRWINKWNGSVTLLYEAGTYRNDTTYVDGERMFYGLQLNVNEPKTTILSQDICEGTAFLFNGKELTEQGTYFDSLKTADGCDSIVVLNLTVHPGYYHIIERTINEGDSVLFFNEWKKVPHTYLHHDTTSFGCDSIVELRLYVTRLYDDSITICSNELPYIWHNQQILQTGIYRDTLRTDDGKQSVIGIKVNVIPIVRSEEPVVKVICEGDYFKFGQAILTQQGTYYDTLTAVNGCDSIVMLSLQVLPVEYQTEYRRIFEGDSVFFDGKWLKESGVYEKRVINENQCTNTYQLVLTVLHVFNVDTTAYVCENELPFIWHGYSYSEEGDYQLPVVWNDSARITMTLHLNINPAFYGEKNVNLCSGGTYIFKGREYQSSCIFYDTIPSLVGCDSIIKYVVSVHPTYDRIDTVHISDKQSYDFHGRILNSSGSYEHSELTKHGCDSIEHLILIVHPSYFFDDSVDVCQSDTLNYPYKWRDMEISKSGIYTDSILTIYGFDSVYQIKVRVHPSYYINEQYEIAEGEQLRIHGKDISNPGIYEDSLLSVYGCDSVYHIVVNPKRTREITRIAEICQGEYYDFYGRKLTHTGNYVYTSQYKDSIITLKLTVNPVTITEERIVITTAQLPYIHNGQLYTEGGVYADTTVNRYGCDSIHRFVLVATSHYSDWTPIPLCPGSEVKIDGEVITEAGLYSFIRRSRVTGEMDSIYRVEIYDAPAYDMPLVQRTICDGDTIFIGGKAVTRAGHYDFRLKTREGCDSLLHLDLTVNPSYRYFTDATIRDFETFTWLGKEYTAEGIYDRTWPTIEDCDSTYTLRLKVIPTLRYSTVDTICDGQSYNWRGNTYDKDGYYTDTVYRPETFYSAIHTLQLTVMRPTYILSSKVKDVCADADHFEIEFAYTGAKPSTYSIFFDQLAKDQGFEDIINKPFLGEDRIARAPVPSKSEVIYMGHTEYVRPNRYGLRMVLDNGVCGISQSDSLVLLVRYPNWIIEQNWNDIVVPLKPEYNGGFEFSQVNWYINGTLQTNNGLGYLHNKNLEDGDEVVMSATRRGESYAIPSCPLIISINLNTADDEPILVYPTKAPHRAPHITVEAPQGGEYEIYSSMGNRVSGATLSEGKNPITLPTNSGIYFIRTKNKDKAETHKVILY